jgi:hypothetical protein
VTDFLREVRPSPTPGFEVRFDTPPGDQAQVDFARFHVVFTDEPGAARIVWLFSLVLGYSRLIWARFVAHQDLQTVLRRGAQPGRRDPIFEADRLIAVHPVLEGRHQRRRAPGHRKMPMLTTTEIGAGAVPIGRAGDVVARRALDLYGMLIDARGERLTPSHAVKNGRRYRYYVSAALITEAATDRAPGWRLPAQEIEDAAIRVLAGALTSPSSLLERFSASGIPGEQIRKLLDRATRLAAALKRSPAEQARIVHDLIDKVVLEENRIVVRVRPAALLGGAVAPSFETSNDGSIEFAATIAIKRRGVEIKLVLPGLSPPDHRSRRDPALIKAIARRRAGFEELAAGRA